MINSPRKRKLSSVLSPESGFSLHTPKKVRETENDVRRSPRLMSLIPHLGTSPSIKACKTIYPSSPRTPTGKENLTTSPHRLVYLSRRNMDEGSPRHSPRICTESFYQRKTQYLDPLQRKALGIRKALISDLKNVSQIKHLKSTNLKYRTTQKRKTAIRKLNSNSNNAMVLHKQKYQPNTLDAVVTKPIKNEVRNDVSVRSSPRKASIAPACVSPVTPTMARKFFTSRSPKSDSKRWSTTTRGGVFHIKFKAESTAQLKRKSKPMKKKIPLDIRVVKSKKFVTAPTRKVRSKQNIFSVNESQARFKLTSDQIMSPVVVLSQEDQKICKISSESILRMDKPNVTTSLSSRKEGETILSGNIQVSSPDQSSGNLGSSPKKCYPIFAKASSSKPMNSVDKSGTKSPATRKASPRIKPRVRYSTKGDKKEQLIIDAGQRELGARQCPTCNMVYMIGEPQDEKCHSSYHDMFISRLKFPGWKKERVLGAFIDGRVIMVLPTDSSFMVKKVEEIRQFVDRFVVLITDTFPIYATTFKL
ncbi:N-acetyltransferase ESCO2-like [Limulus polyphemus]|uniref:N-acetyltransferase ESCO2-like n=1 Tax=Limulus polyphemus TaxID=6850 RepID=A0ABM1TRV0_LIMPO|nr:N-acetyltransferase ESCO2-like [Limulus polyphemus]